MSRRGAELVGVLGWVLAVAIAVNALPWPAGRWLSVGYQVAVYLVMAAPVLALRPRLVHGLTSSGPQLAVAVTVVVSAEVAAAVVDRLSLAAAAALLVRLSATSIVEELIFRGWLWRLLVACLFN